MNIIFEDTNYLILDKEAGVVVHSDGRTKEGSVVEWLTKEYPKLSSVGGVFDVTGTDGIPRYGVVHRIDRETSGVLVVAKNQKTFEHLQAQFQNHQVKKIYHAFVYSPINEDSGTIDRPIGRSSNDFRMWSAQRGARGTLREALTFFRVLARSKEATFVEAEPKTGRTHQIRVHFKAISHPVVADKLYGAGYKPILGFTRLALHARSIEFMSIKDKKLSFEAPYPKDFKLAIKMIEKVA
jgi:23S rRNA pseudouridine1911/1915/1917 synthase